MDPYLLVPRCGESLCGERQAAAEIEQRWAECLPWRRNPNSFYALPPGHTSFTLLSSDQVLSLGTSPLQEPTKDRSVQARCLGFHLPRLHGEGT